MGAVFGPVSSRRLGRSLGVDLVPLKTCSFDCLYCQAGRTTHKTTSPGEFIPVESVLEELEARLKETNPDVVTFSGSGEPTLHTGIDRVITKVKTITDTDVAVLTNGSLLWRPEVRERLRRADMVMPTLSSVLDETFQRIHRPHESLDLQRILEGLNRFREVFHGSLNIEVVLLQGINDGDEEIEALAKALEGISPDRIQLNTVVRPPASSEAVALDRGRLEAIRGFLGEKAEIIAGAPVSKERTESEDLTRTVFEMARRRSVRITDVADFLGLDTGTAEDILRSLIDRGDLLCREHDGMVYFSAVEGVSGTG